MNEFRFLSTDSTEHKGGSTRSQDYNRVAQALKRLGFHEEYVSTIWRILAAILHLGNMDFIPKVSFSSL